MYELNREKQADAWEVNQDRNALARERVELEKERADRATARDQEHINIQKWINEYDYAVQQASKKHPAGTQQHELDITEVFNDPRFSGIRSTMGGNRIYEDTMKEHNEARRYITQTYWDRRKAVENSVKIATHGSDLTPYDIAEMPETAWSEKGAAPGSVWLARDTATKKILTPEEVQARGRTHYRGPPTYTPDVTFTTVDKDVLEGLRKDSKDIIRHKDLDELPAVYGPGGKRVPSQDDYIHYIMRNKDLGPGKDAQAARQQMINDGYDIP
jgi:hypothetical protein